MLIIERARYIDFPILSALTSAQVLKKFFAVKNEIMRIVNSELERMLETPELNQFII